MMSNLDEKDIKGKAFDFSFEVGGKSVVIREEN